VAQELSLDLASARAYLAELERRGWVGPVLISSTGARESLVNIVLDESPNPSVALAPVDPRPGQRAVARASVLALIALMGMAALAWSGAGNALAQWFAVDTLSPFAAAIVRSGTPAAAPLAAWIVDQLLGLGDPDLGESAQRLQAAVWHAITLATVLAVALSLLR